MKRKLLAFVIILTLLFPASIFAGTFEDIAGHWAETYLTEAVNRGWLKGYGDSMRPDAPITKAEALTLINRILGTPKSSKILDYSDLDKNAWFYEEFQKAELSNLLLNDAGKVNPNDPITREEVFTIIATILDLKSNEGVKGFSDINKVADWAKSSVIGLINGNYVEGFEGKIQPKAGITRGELATMLLRVFPNTEIKDGDTIVGNLVVNTPDKVIKSVKVKGDLIVADGVDNGDLTLEDVEISGRLIVRGGGTNSIKINRGSIRQIITANQFQRVRVAVVGTTIGSITVAGNQGLIVEGAVGNLDLNSAGSPVELRNAVVDNVNLNTAGSALEVGAGSTVTDVAVNSPEGSITGKGKVSAVTVGARGRGTKVETEGAKVTVAQGATGVTGVGNVQLNPGQTQTTTTPTTPTTPTSGGGGGGGGGGSSSGGSSSGGNTDPTPPTPPVKYSVTYSAVGEGTLSADVESGSKVDPDTVIEFTAEPEEAFRIVKWTINGEDLTLTREIHGEEREFLNREPVIELEIKANTVVTVEFEEDPYYGLHSVDVFVTDSLGGTAEIYVPQTGEQGDSLFVEGETFIDLVIRPFEDYRIYKVTMNGQPLYYQYNIRITEDTVIEVEFEEIPEPVFYHVKATTSDDTMGRVVVTYSDEFGMPVGEIPAEGIDLLEGTFISYHVEVEEGYKNLGLILNGEEITEHSGYRSILEDMEFEISFRPLEEYTVTAHVYGGNGSLRIEANNSPVVSGTVLLEDSFVVIYTDADDGYVWATWTVNGKPVEHPSSALLLPTLSEDIEVIVTFKEYIPPVTYTVSYSVYAEDADNRVIANVYDAEGNWTMFDAMGNSILQVGQKIEIEVEDYDADKVEIVDWLIGGVATGYKEPIYYLENITSDLDVVVHIKKR